MDIRRAGLLHARAARLIYGIKDKMSVSNTFARVKWEPISYIYKRRVLTWMQKMYYENCPQPLCGIINITTSLPLKCGLEQQKDHLPKRRKRLGTS